MLTCWDEIEIIGSEENNGKKKWKKKKSEDLVDEIDDSLIEEFNMGSE